MLQNQLIEGPVTYQLSNKLNQNPHNVIFHKTQRAMRLKNRGKEYSRAIGLEMSLNQSNDASFKNFELMASLPLKTKSGKKKGEQSSEKTETASHTNIKIKSMEKLRSNSLCTSSPAGFAIRLKNKYKQIEKQAHKGKNNFNIKSVERWLNDLLTQYCSNETFQSNIMNPALKRFQIDRNSLISQGISHHNIDRVYRSLFVYSLGFNRLLEQICVSSSTYSIRKTLWKVYAMLLEYCAKGEFETMIGEIERDKVEKVEGLRGEIMKAHKLIDTVEESMKDQKSKLHKQMKLIKDANQTLLSEINILENDFKKAEIAFNQQVRLRLRFEHKINEIYGVHQELSTKHGTLYKDYHVLLEQYNQQKRNLQKQIRKKEEVILKTIEFQQKIEEQKREMETKSSEIDKLSSKVKVLELKLQSYETHRHAGLINARNQIRQNKMLHFELNNVKEVLSLKEKSFDEMQRRSHILVSQNQKLFERVEEQNKRIIDLNRSQHQFELTTLNLKSSLQYKDKKFQAVEKQRNNDKLKIQESEKKVVEWEVEIKTSREKIKLLTSDIQIFNKNLELMKKSKNNIEDELNSIKGRYDQMVELLNGRESAESKLARQLNDVQHELIKAKEKLYSVQTVLAMREQDLKHQKLTSKRIIEKLIGEKETLKDQKEFIEQKLIVLEKENETCREEEAVAKKQLMDLMFEKTDCDLRLKQSLLMMEDESKYIKDLSIKISHLSEQKEELKRKLNNLQIAYNKKEEELRRERIDYERRIKEQEAEIRRKFEWVHPMKYADLEGLWINQKEVIRVKTKEISDLEYQVGRVREANKKEMDSVKSGYMDRMNGMQKQLSKAVEEQDELIRELNRKINKVENQLKQKVKSISELTTSLQNSGETIRKESQRACELETEIQQLKQEIQILNGSISLKKGQSKNLNDQLKQKVSSLELDVKRLEKKVQQLQTELQAARKNKEPNNKYSNNQQNNSSKQEHFDEQYIIGPKQTKKHHSDFENQKLIKEQQQGRVRGNQRSETEESHLQFNLLPKNSLARSKASPPLSLHELDKIEQEEKSGEKSKEKVVSARPKAIMTRKEVVNKIYGAYNYYNSRK